MPGRSRSVRGASQSVFLRPPARRAGRPSERVKLALSVAISPIQKGRDGASGSGLTFAAERLARAAQCAAVQGAFMTFRDVQSGVSLPSLQDLKSLAPLEREAALQGWVVWLDANRHRVSRRTELLLDRALRDLREDTARKRPASELDAGYEDWLENAGSVGRGRGPDEEDEGV